MERMIAVQNTDNICLGCMGETNGEQVCPVCGFDKTKYAEPGALKLGTVLADRYLVGKVIATSGQGFTYLGLDKVTDKTVKVKEYFPTGLCSRTDDDAVEINGSTAYVFNDGIIKFISLYKKLGLMSDLPALYKVIDIFETNKTAYCISEYLPGIPFKEFLIRNGGFLNWEQVRPLFVPLISAFDALHKNGIVHGGISPDTLVVGRDGRIRIAGFCINSVRNAKSEMTAQLFTGYAAAEQYLGKDLTSATDVYGFAATMFRSLTGNPPPDSLGRMENDSMSFPKSVADNLPRGVLVAMANALQVDPEDRTFTMEEFKDDLMSAIEESTVENTGDDNEKIDKSITRKYTLFAALATAVVLALIAGIIYLAFGRKPDKTTSTVSVPSIASIGDIGNSEKPENLYSVPDFSGNTLTALLENEEYQKWFEFKVAKKEYNDKVAKGKVCAQTVAVGTSVKKGTEVQLTISLGPSSVTIPKKLKGMSKTEAYIALLEMGFDPQNIEFIEKKDSTPTREEVVIATSPDIGASISPDEHIVVYYNTNLIANDADNSSDMVLD